METESKPLNKETKRELAKMRICYILIDNAGKVCSSQAEAILKLLEDEFSVSFY